MESNLISDFVKASLIAWCNECGRELEVKAVIKINGTYRPFCIDCFKKMIGDGS